MSPEPPGVHDLKTDRLVAATKKVREHLDAPGSGDPRLPILNFTDAREYAAVFDHLKEQLKAKTPVADIDCEGYREETIPALLVEVKRQLSQHCEDYPRRQFRRLELGLGAIKAPFSFAVQGMADRQVSQLVRETARPKLETGGLGIIDLVRLLPSKLASAAGTLAIYLFQHGSPAGYDFYRWYGHRDRNLGTPPKDLIQDLNRWQHPEGKDQAPDRRRRDGLLIEALLADVRFSYRRGPLSRSGWYSSVVLLRRADNPAVVTLLERLQGLRRFLTEKGVPAEALLVIAGSEEHISGCLSDETAGGGAN